MSSKFTEINATVLEQTAMAIEKYTKKYNLSTGEVIDKLLLNFCTNDPDLAAQFICQFFISTISKQTEEQKKKTLLKTIAFLTVPLMMDNTNNITISLDIAIEEIKKACENLFSEIYNEIKNGSINISEFIEE